MDVYVMGENVLIMCSNILCMIFVIVPFCYTLYFICKFILAQCVKCVLNIIVRITEFLNYYIRLDKKSTAFYGIMLRCLKASSLDIGSSIQTPRRVDRFAMLNNLFAQNILMPPYPNRIFLVCAPKDKEENLCRALMHFLYARLRTEATSQTILNPAGNFDLLAECPNLASLSGLERFPANFKGIKDTAVEEILRSTPNVDALSVSQYNLLVELIKLIMIKKAFENIHAFNTSIGCIQVRNIVDEICNNDFIPSSMDMIRFISASFNISVSIITPSDKVANLYNNYESIIISIHGQPHVSRMMLLEQESGSYTLVV